jgi:predicted PurR-regulated permease PerM
MPSEIKLPSYAKATIILVLLFVITLVLFLVQGIIVPLIYSSIIAILLSPVLAAFVSMRFNRILAISLTLFVLVFMLVGMAFLLSSQMVQFSNSIPSLIIKFHDMMNYSESWASHYFHISTSKIDIWLVEKNLEILNSSSSLIGQTLIKNESGLFTLILIPIYIFLILLYQPLLIEFIHKLVNEHKYDDLKSVLTTTKKNIQSYLMGLLSETVIIFILYASSLMLLGIEYAMLLGFIGAILNVIRFIGGIFTMTLPFIIAFATKSFDYSLLVIVIYLLIKFIDMNLIVPRLVASKLQLNALISFLVVFAGGSIWGTHGMFLSIPLIAIVKVVFDHVDELKPWGFLLGNALPESKK